MRQIESRLRRLEQLPGDKLLAARLVRLERNTGSCRPRVAVIERGDHDRARQFLQDNGVDLARVMFVVTGVLRGQPEHEKQACWLRAAAML